MATSEIRTEPVAGPMAWDATRSVNDDGKVILDTACMTELEAVADALIANPLPVTLLDSNDFDLTACRAVCQQAREQLDRGIGYAIIETLPVDRYDYDISVKLYWLLLSMVGRPVAQKWNGEMIYDVTDTGKKATAGSGVRSSKTNGGQKYHTDNSFNLPPDHVSLMCLRPAVTGGVSGLISFDSIYNQLIERHPDVLERLYEPFYFDRQREHSPDDTLVYQAPVFEVQDGDLKVRLATNLIRQGYEVAGKAIDEPTERALQALDEVMESDGLGRTFDFEPGQIQIVNNRRLGHRRTAFTDADDPELKRHLVRIWLRDEGKRFYAG